MRTSFRPLSLLPAVSSTVFLLAACDRTGNSPVQTAGVTVKAAAQPAPLPKPPQARYQRDLYGRLDDCVADWGFAGKCIPLAADAPERAQGGTFFGPIYSNALRAESQLASRREALEQGYLRQLDESPSNKAILSADIKS